MNIVQPKLQANTASSNNKGKSFNSCSDQAGWEDRGDRRSNKREPGELKGELLGNRGLVQLNLRKTMINKNKRTVLIYLYIFREKLSKTPFRLR